MKDRLLFKNVFDIIGSSSTLFPLFMELIKWLGPMGYLI